jgi:hypothetical protein
VIQTFATTHAQQTKKQNKPSIIMRKTKEIKTQKTTQKIMNRKDVSTSR